MLLETCKMHSEVITYIGTTGLICFKQIDKSKWQIKQDLEVFTGKC